MLCRAMASFAPAPNTAAVRRGKELHIPRFSALPPLCVNCGAAAQVPWRKKFYWHTQWIFLLVLLNIVVYLIVALIVRKQMELNVPLCDKHHAERKRYNLLGALFTLGALPVGIFIGTAFNDAEGFAWLTGFGMFVAGVVFLILAGKYLRPKKIDDQGGIFTGASEAFLTQLPNG
jgi:hypothetical protein